MDIITQGVLGATLAQSASSKEKIRYAGIAGFASGMLADADVLIRSNSDPLLFLEYHRHFTHSLAFIPIGALIASMLLFPFLKRMLSFRMTYFFAFLGFATSGILDACTSYGTSLLLPFSDARIAFNIISIVDPVFSLSLLTGLIFGFVRKKPRAAQIGLMMAGCYLLFGFVQHTRAANLASTLAASRGHLPKIAMVKPTLGNLMLWRSVYQHGNNYYIDAVRPALIGGNRIYEGKAIPKFEIERELPEITADSTHYRDIRRFNHFSNGFLVRHPGRPDILGDVRYSMLPNSTIPLWGIKLNLKHPNQHVGYETFRKQTKAERQKFFAMILGKKLISDLK